MAEIVVTAVITVLCEKLISGDLMKLAQSEGIDSKLNKWKKTLPLIQAVLADADKKQITESPVRMWVNDLQDLAYDMEGVLDEIAAEALQRKLNHEPHASTSTSKLFKFVPTCCSNFTPRNIVYGQQMSLKLDDITTKLSDLVEVKNGLGLSVHNVTVESLNRIERPWEKTSVVDDESKIMGREGDKEVLLGKLLVSDEKMSIVSIIGMCGIGKTRLAKILYNDNKVMDHFELKSWVCVSDEFSVFNICKAIFQKVNGTNQDFADLNLLQEALKGKLQNIRFLIVLDDVLNEDESKWEILKGHLLGRPGSKIIVTTWNTRVASVMDSDEVYHLDVLSNEDALSLFSQHALGEKSFEKYPALKLHGEGMVNKCGRLPLALKTLGRVMKGKRNSDEWEKLKSEIWDIQDGKGILPALRLSYYHLPTHLKQPFAYCSSYPKDYVFDKKELVLFWMAQGFLSQSHGNMSMESLGYEYFEELQSRSFFLHSTNEELGYTMHDLINDLATSVAGEFFFRLDDEMDAPDSKEAFENFRHVSIVGEQCGSYRKLKELQRATRLRSLLLVPSGWVDVDLSDNVLVELLPQLRFLRVLSLTNGSIMEAPKSICHLKHLRYLNFSYTEIISLPEQLSDLYNLQSLLVHGCVELCSFPESFRKLINLRHLGLCNTPKVERMPLGIGGLTSLQTLSKVNITEGANGFKISDLKDLLELKGRLSIMGLDKVINPVEAKHVNLHQKKGLDVLKMEWSDEFEDSRNEMTEYEVLEALRPHHKLGILKISFYMGTTFPNWVGDPSFDRLTKLTFYGCRSKHLPTLGHLSSLKKLCVERMNEVETVGFELLGPTNSRDDIAFPSLEVLKFFDMQDWERWSTIRCDDTRTTRSFPLLRKISIKGCYNLSEVSIGLIPSLRVLEIRECSEIALRSIIGASSSVVRLVMADVKGLTQINEE